MTNKDKKSQCSVAGSAPDMVCTRQDPSQLLHELRMHYRLLTVAQQNQVKAFILRFYASDGWRAPTLKLEKAEVEH